MSLLTAAHTYLAAGLCVLPAHRSQKRPSVGRWKQYQTRLPTEAELSAWIANNPDALCILCGQASGNAEIIDFDARGELFDAWCLKVQAAAPGLLERLVLSRTQSDGRHAFYRCTTAVSGNLKLAQRRVGEKVVTLIETRGEGGLFLCAPTAGYEVIQGDLASPTMLTDAERDVLLQAAWELNEYQPPVVDGPTRSADVGPARALSADNGGLSAEIPHGGDCSLNNAAVGLTSPLSVEQCGGRPDNGLRPGDDFNTRGDVRAVLRDAGWALARTGENEYWRRPGKTSGWSATLKGRVFYVFSANAAPFEPGKAYSPFSVYTLLNHGGDYEQAARSLRLTGYGGDCATDIRSDVDISAIVRMSAASGDLCQTTGLCGGESPCGPEIADPGPMPTEMLRVPGFINEVMDHCLAIAPYPNQVMAFGGALALQAFLAGRKVRDPGDNRTNLYLLGLAHAGAGKDQSRKVNSDIIHSVGLGDGLGLHFASGEGIQDALFQTPAMLFQTDEIDGMLQSINKAKDARHEAIMSTLLTMYSSANSIFPMRRKAGKESPGVINQPCLVVYGTAIPNHYYQALSERMLTNGFFARMIILEAGPRSPGQEPSIRNLPPRVRETAQWWTDYRPGTGNLEDWNPVPTIIEHSEEARGLLIEMRLEAEAQYGKAEEASDPVGTTVWGRVSEHIRKLALLHAISENHLSPRISLAAVEWASRFVMHQTRRMLFMAAHHVADNPFHAECLKLMEKLREAPGFELPHSVLLKRMKMDAKTFAMLIETLAQQGDIQVVTVPRTGTYLRMYRLSRGVKPEGEMSGGGER